LTLVNEAHGTIEANIAGGTLTLDTGHTITNDGIMEATNGGTLQVDDAVSGAGCAIIAGGTLAFDAQSNVNVTFDNGTGSPTYGELVLGDAFHFSGEISGFTGTAPDTAHSDAIDLTDIAFNSNTTFTFQDNAGTDTGGTLTILESGKAVDSITFANGDYTTASFTFSSDGSGGTLITDPPTSTALNNTLTGAGGNDTFIFKTFAHSPTGSGNFDTLTDFINSSSHIDLSAIDGIAHNHDAGSSGGTINPNSIAWIVNNKQNMIDIHANAGSTPETVAGHSSYVPDMQVHQTHAASLHGANFILHA